jgi:uncharacterized membrane protein HdeD (DUF308 family)
MREVEGARIQVSTVPWWLLLITGVAAVVLGILLIMAPLMLPFQNTGALMQFVGIYWLVTGVFFTVSIIVERSHWVWRLFSGILSTAAGVFLSIAAALLLVVGPFWGAFVFSTTLIVAAAVMGMVVGILLFFLVFIERSWGVGMLAVLSIILSVFLFLSPFISMVALPFVAGGLAILGGIAAIVSSFSNRKESAIPAPTGGSNAINRRNLHLEQKLKYAR